MRRTFAARLLATTGLAMLLGLTGCAATEPTVAEADRPADQPADPGLILADFERAWELVRDTHYDTEYNGVDWHALREELKPRAERARTRAQGRSIINEMVSRLNQSHFALIPAELERDLPSETDEPDPSEIESAADAGTPEIPSAGEGSGRGVPGFEVRIAEGRAVVTRVRAGAPAELAGVRPGWVVTRVRNTDIDALIARMGEAMGEDASPMYAWQSVDSMLKGRVGSSVPVTFLDADDAEAELSIERVSPPGEFVKFGNLPPLSTHLEHRWLTTEETGDPDTRIGYIAFNIFMVPIAPQFEQAMVELKDADGIIIDLRGNPGGVGFMASTLSRFLLATKANLGTMTMRGAEMNFFVEPVMVTTRGERLRPFAGPVAIVIDGTSASTSEVFAGGLRSLGRAKTFGTRTAGMALPAAMSRLPSGDVLLHAIADYVNSDGTRLEGDGVPADVEAPVRRQDLLDGVDAPLREAARWIVTESAMREGVSAGAH
ncbi:MAG: hypothetical protein LAT64_06770 [Phycisphaerales bacterium]|nr:hypothetical protein [Planctomycetota bacterium]MCH8508458.1 hypothetical protein [Phycisphaerales bacterium]